MVQFLFDYAPPSIYDCIWLSYGKARLINKIYLKIKHFVTSHYNSGREMWLADDEDVSCVWQERPNVLIAANLFMAVARNGTNSVGIVWGLGRTY